MRVAVVVSQLGRGGAEQQTVLLLSALADSPRRPALVVCLSDELLPHASTIRGLGYPLRVLPRHGSFDASRLLRLRRLLAGERIELVHAVHLLASAYAFLACGSRGPVVLPTVRGTVVHPTAVKRWVFRRMFRNTPRTLVNSERGARFIVEHLGAPPERVVVVPNGIDFDALAQRARVRTLRRELGLAPDTPLVGFAGKASRVKNVPRFIEVVRRLLAERPGLHAVLAGGGLDDAARARLAPDLPASRIHFLGPRDDLPAVLADLDVLLLTSDTEGSPNVVLEALGVGTPVVSADVGDIALMVPRAEWVVPPDDVAAYVAAALAVLSGPGAAREAVGAARDRLVAGYGLDRMVRETLATWDVALDDGRRPTRHA